MSAIEDKIDGIAREVSETKGMLGEALPNLKQLGQQHDRRINTLEIKHENMHTKVGLAGSGAGAIAAILMEWVLKHIHF